MTFLFPVDIVELPIDKFVAGKENERIEKR